MHLKLLFNGKLNIGWLEYIKNEKWVHAYSNPLKKDKRTSRRANPTSKDNKKKGTQQYPKGSIQKQIRSKQNQRELNKG